MRRCCRVPRGKRKSGRRRRKTAPFVSFVKGIVFLPRKKKERSLAEPTKEIMTFRRRYCSDKYQKKMKDRNGLRGGAFFFHLWRVAKKKKVGGFKNMRAAENKRPKPQNAVSGLVIQSWLPAGLVFAAACNTDEARFVSTETFCFSLEKKIASLSLALSLSLSLPL